MIRLRTLMGLLALSILPVSAQQLTAVKDVVDCGNIVYNAPATAEFLLENRGSAPLNIKNVRVSCGCLEAEYPKQPIAAGEKFTLRLTYDAMQMGHFFKSAGVYTDAAETPLYLTMKGVVRAYLKDYSGTYHYRVGNLRVDKLDIEFDDVNKGDSPEQVIHLVNVGTKSVQPNIMHMPPYLSAVASPETLLPGKAGKITLTLTSEKLRDYGLTQTSVYLANELGDRISTASEISVSSVLLHDFTGMTDGERMNAPKMVLSADSLNLAFDGKAKRSGKIVITNNGKTTLKITSLQMFTKGLKITLNKREIAPGKTATLKVTAMRDHLKKVRTQPRVLMITNDPERSKVTVNVNAK